MRLRTDAPVTTGRGNSDWREPAGAAYGPTKLGKASLTEPLFLGDWTHCEPDQDSGARPHRRRDNPDRNARRPLAAADAAAASDPQRDRGRDPPLPDLGR